MLDYLDKGYFVMFFFGFLIDKINLFPFFLGISLGLFISTNNSTIKYLSLFNQSYSYIKKNLDIYIPDDTFISKENIISKNINTTTNDINTTTTNDINTTTNDINTTTTNDINTTTNDYQSSNPENCQQVDSNENIKSPL